MFRCRFLSRPAWLHAGAFEAFASISHCVSESWGGEDIAAWTHTSVPVFLFSKKKARAQAVSDGEPYCANISPLYRFLSLLSLSG